MEGNYRGIIFDFFGTLSVQNCAPEDKIIEGFKLYQQRNFSYEFVEDVVCGTACPTPFEVADRESYYETLGELLGIPRRDMNRLHNIMKEDIAGEDLVDGAVEIVRYAKERCNKMGMISDLPNPDYDLSAKWGFADLFDFRHMSYDPEWVDSNQGEGRVLKPNPEVFKRTLSYLDTDSQNTVMIGNSMHSDIEPSRTLGMRGILVDFHDKYPDDLDRITSLEDLRRIL